MKIVEHYLTKNRCFNDGRALSPRGLMLHSVGCPQPSAGVFLRNWDNETTAACVHAFIDANDGTVYQTLPWNKRGWHAGGAANNTHIGVEMCEPPTIKYTSGANYVDTNPTATREYVLRTYMVAVELFADLCKRYHLDPHRDIISHAEGRAKGIASNHADPAHLWDAFGLTMDGFRDDVAATMRDADGNAWSRDAREWCISNGIFRGYSDGSFGWGDNLTREQMAVILYRIFVEGGDWPWLK